MGLTKITLSLQPLNSAAGFINIEKECAAGISADEIKNLFIQFSAECLKSKFLPILQKGSRIQIDFWGNDFGWSIPRCLIEIANKNGWVFSYKFHHFDFPNCQLPPK